VALPLSLIRELRRLWFSGFSLGQSVADGATIGTGFVVDDAIVMIEKYRGAISRTREPARCALRGAKNRLPR